jgi:hypothetical protein
MVRGGNFPFEKRGIFSAAGDKTPHEDLNLKIPKTSEYLSQINAQQWMCCYLGQQWNGPVLILVLSVDFNLLMNASSAANVCGEVALGKH